MADFEIDERVDITEVLRKKDSRYLNLLTMKMEHMTLSLKRLKNKSVEK